MKEGFVSNFSISETYGKEKLSRCYAYLYTYSCETRKLFVSLDLTSLPMKRG